MILCAGNNETFKFATPIGVGLIDSAINLTKLCLMSVPENLIFIGTAGSYGRYNIFDIVETSTSSNIENSFLTNQSYTPIDNIVSATTNKEVIVNSSNYITTSKNLSKQYLSLGIDLENMEFYSVVKVAKEFNLPVKGIFVVTNYCNDEAHSQFISNHPKAKKLLLEYLKSFKTISF